MAHQMSPSNHDPNSDSSKARLYNPYQDLQVPMRNLYQLPTSPEFLFVKEAKRAIGGGATDLFSGIRSFKSEDTTKLRISRDLNSYGHTGRAWGSQLGRWAGLGTGAIYRAAKGVRSAAVAGAIGGVLVGVIVTSKQAAK
ncbi:hypothetical protein C1H46_003810 [Malus baccata]|uniref:Uncharacterized protein n=1 Tax=Malus baccata TaxID=106549 RepID=A0A540NHQ2_MALBA|nr:hypothetical protein C1H46_003810 [Malus baccata]